MKKIHSVNNDFVNARLDKWYKRNICDVPQSLLEKNIRKGKIKVNNKKVKSSYKLKKNDEIFIFDFNPTLDKKNKNKYLPSKKEISSTSKFIIEDNDNFIVINKPAGLPVQSGTKSKRNIMDILGKNKHFLYSKPYTVHRIDKETTGVLLIAKNRKYAQLFTSLFRIRKIYKTYLCIVIGEMEKNKGTFEDILYYYEKDKKISAKAITHYEVLDSNNNYSFLKLNPTTGRKHQIRKQLFIRNHPVLGDDKYNYPHYKFNKKNKLMLHAYKLNFFIDNKKYELIAEISDDFKKILKEKYLKNSF